MHLFFPLHVNAFVVDIRTPMGALELALELESSQLANRWGQANCEITARQVCSDYQVYGEDLEGRFPSRPRSEEKSKGLVGKS